MAVAYTYDVSADPETYRRVADEADMSRKPQGLLLHAAGKADTGAWHIIEVWESDDARNQWVQERLLPALQRAGVDTSVQPVWTRVEVEHLITR
jgi:hypothetical protein